MENFRNRKGSCLFFLTGGLATPHGSVLKINGLDADGILVDYHVPLGEPVGRKTLA